MPRKTGSNTVQPIRDKEKIQAVKKYLLKKSQRDHFLFHMGINIGIRISDLIQLKVCDVKGKRFTYVKEQKTGNKKKITINPSLRDAIEDYIDLMELESNDWLFPSRKGDKHITRVQAYRILNDAAKHVGLEEIGTHSLRKTFGYHYYQKTKDVAMLQEIFGHSAPSITLRYIGINDEMIGESLEDFVL
ncbi:site-specific integrase [Priestia megaterium]|uniref:site-specific integrase n=1 Tax=Priestia megaterium TaxID=1404 RepID=UPI00277DB477|nr:site-specific integrase [Priestia megaterium]MDQ0808039.1 integrase [Priestia megaterium]